MTGFQVPEILSHLKSLKAYIFKREKLCFKNIQVLPSKTDIELKIKTAELLILTPVK